MEEQLRQNIGKYVTLSDSEWQLFYAAFQSKTYAKKAFLFREGEICSHKYFLVEGLVRAFFIGAKSHEKITYFAIENWWFSNLESYVHQTPSNISVQALEKTQVLRIPKRELELLLIRIPKLERLFRLLSENMLIALLRKKEVFDPVSADQNYFQFVAALPEFAQRVPQYMIASYLEMTPEYLSEIRKKGPPSIS